MKTNWKILRRVLIALAAIGTLVALFYPVENWSGRRAWEECKRELRAKGAVLDWGAYIPPPVPDDQNIFKAPKIQEWFVGRERTDLSRRMASTNSASGPIEGLTLQDATNYLAWSDQFASDLDTIREALKRPFARIDGDYEQTYDIPTPNFVGLRVVAQMLARRAQCYLLLQEPENALHELTLMHDIRRFLEPGPTGKPITLVSAMVDVAITGLYANTIGDGLRVKAWREPQLVALQKQLGATQLSPFVQEAFVDASALVCRTLESTPPVMVGNQRLALPRGTTNMWHSLLDPVTMLSRFAPRGLKVRRIFTPSLLVFSPLAPRGWLYQNMAAYALEQQKLIHIYDPSTKTVSPQKADDVSREMNALKRSSPYTSFASWALPNLVRAWKILALNQSLVNEAMIACALERYHLAHGSYPETLDSLVPQYIDMLPQDIVNGLPLKYHRTTDGKFILYSVAWNGRDDGGSTISHDPVPASQEKPGITRMKGEAVGYRPTADEDDWVWE